MAEAHLHFPHIENPQSDLGHRVAEILVGMQAELEGQAPVAGEIQQAGQE